MPKPVLVSPGACIAISLKPRLYGACRVVGKTSYGPTVQVVDWFSSVPPSCEEICSAKAASFRKVTLGLGPGPLLYSLQDGPARLPKGFSVVGREPKVVRKTATPDLGMWWTDIRAAALVASSLKGGKDPMRTVKQETAREGREAAKRVGLSPGLHRLRQDAREVARMWRAGEYDNLKDVVEELTELLPRVLRAFPNEAALLGRVKTAVARKLRRLLNDSDLGPDAHSWIKHLESL